MDPWECTVDDLRSQYRAGRENAILVDRSALGRLLIRGRDAPDLMHRLTTNDVKSLRSGEGTAAVFTTPKGRILDLVTFRRLEDRLLCLTGEGRGPTIADWIGRYTFREEVEVEDQSASHALLGIFGPRAGAPVERLFGREAAARPRHHPTLVRLGEVEGVLARTFPLGGEGFLLQAETPALPGLRDRILEEGKGLIAADAVCLEVLRIEAGLPAPGRELTEEYNPWEARLGDAISLDKGCYVGQEVIARLNTYQKISKQLVRLRIEGASVPATPTPLQDRGRPIGTLTSAAAVPGEGRVVALGYVNDEDAIAGKVVDSLGEGGPRVATIEGLAR